MKMSARSKWILLISVSLAGLGLDILTKTIATRTLVPGLPVPVFNEFFEFMLLFNRNAIFGINPRVWIPGFPINLFFYVFSTIAIVILVVYYRSCTTGGRPTIWGIALIMPGALGNLYDRVVFPGRGVVDFIKIGLSREIYWPIFNFADIYISVGVGLIILDLIRDELKKKASAKQTHD
jgi:signal peptidase II